MRDQTCCFSGHRTIREDQLDAVTARTEIIIRDLIVKRNIRFFVEYLVDEGKLEMQCINGTVYYKKKLR